MWGAIPLFWFSFPWWLVIIFSCIFDYLYFFGHHLFSWHCRCSWKVDLGPKSSKGKLVNLGYFRNWWSRYRQVQVRRTWDVNVAGVLKEEKRYQQSGSLDNKGKNGDKIMRGYIVILRLQAFFWVIIKTSGGVWNLLCLLYARVINLLHF